MNDAGEPSRAAVRPDDLPRPRPTRPTRPPPAPLDDAADVDAQEAARGRAKEARERRLDAKRKRIRMLGELLRELDLAVYTELLALYHLDCSFFWFALRALAHGSLLTPVADPTTQRPPDEPRPFLPVVAGLFIVNFVLHMLHPTPTAGEDTRGYLHGGLLMDFIGQQGPTSKWKLGALDLCIMLLQLVMVSAHVKRRDLKKQLALMTAANGPSATAADLATPGTTATSTTSDHAPPSTTSGNAAPSTTSGNAAPNTTSDNAARGQDADDEERGMLHRTDTMSDIGADPEEDDALLHSTSETAHADALDLLTSGQCVILSAGLVDTIWRENENYRAFRQTRTESSLSGDMPDTLRRLNTLRARFGVGGG